MRDYGTETVLDEGVTRTTPDPAFPSRRLRALAPVENVTACGAVLPKRRTGSSGTSLGAWAAGAHWRWLAWQERLNIPEKSVLTSLLGGDPSFGVVAQQRRHELMSLGCELFELLPELREPRSDGVDALCVRQPGESWPRIIVRLAEQREDLAVSFPSGDIQLTRFNWSISPRPGNSGSFWMSSANMQPTDHMSIAVVYSLAPSSSSGARYQSVTTSWVISPSGSPNLRARPKSATLI